MTSPNIFPRDGGAGGAPRGLVPADPRAAAAVRLLVAAAAASAGRVLLGDAATQQRGRADLELTQPSAEHSVGKRNCNFESNF